MSSPETVALKFGNTAVSYVQLWVKAKRIAECICRAKHKATMPAAIYLPRSPEFVFATMGCILSGNTYLPLDPSHPPIRNINILGDSGASLILTTRSLSQALSHLSIPFLFVDELATGIEENAHLFEETNCNLEPTVSATERLPIYILYTSGSTGTPKGVVISGGNLLAFTEIVRATFEIRKKDLCLFSASVAYAVSVRQIFATLLSGATLVIANGDEVADPLQLFKLIVKEKITCIDMVPSYMRSCVELFEKDKTFGELIQCKSFIRLMVSVGEQLHTATAARMYQFLPDNAKIVNILGQTETTGMIACFTIPRDTAGLPGIVPCGKTVKGITAFVLDDAGKVVPKGKEGNLAVSGPTVSPGYFRFPEQDAKRFTTISINGENIRLYITGDCGSIDEEGTITLTGRTDTQIKIAGNRIDAGEVEAVLMQIQGVIEAVICFAELQEGEKYLCAVLRVVNDSSLTINTIKRFIRSRLPGFMVPDFCYTVSSFPLNASGKTDRKQIALLVREQIIKKLNRESSISLRYLHPVFTPAERFGNAKTEPTSTVIAQSQKKMVFSTVFLREGKRSIFQVSDYQRIEGTVRFVQIPANITEFNLETANMPDPVLKQIFLLIKEIDDMKPDRVRIYFSAGEATAINDEDSTREAYALFETVLWVFRVMPSVITRYPVKLIILVHNVFHVHTTGRLHPEGAVLKGILLTAPLEYPLLTTVLADTDSDDNSTTADQRVAVLEDEALASSSGATVVYRKGIRYEIQYDESTPGKTQPLNLPNNGVYVIIGGTGKIGLACAEWLCEGGKCTVILISRGGIAVNERIIESLRNNGNRIETVQADITDYILFSRTLDAIKERYGGITGIIHSAGIRNEFAKISEMRPLMYKAVMSAKVEGTLNLFKCTENVCPEFVIIFSSVSGILGRFGQADYTGANAYLDALSAVPRKYPVYCINWDTWKDEEPKQQPQRVIYTRLITNEEGKTALRTIFKGGALFSVVTHRELSRRSTESVYLTELTERRASFIAPASTLEADLIDIWEQYLGISGIGTTENFFSLGGNSLIAMKIFSQIEIRYGKILPFTGIADAPTVRSQAHRIRNYEVANSSGITICIKSGYPQNIKLFCVSSGMTSFHFYTLASELADDIPVYGVQAMPEMDSITLEARAEMNCAAIKTIQPSGPYLICGESFGGIVAYEMALQLEKNGEKVVFLGLLDTNADQLQQYYKAFSPVVAPAIRVYRSYYRQYRRIVKYLRKLVQRLELGKQEQVYTAPALPDDVVFSNENQRLKYIPKKYTGDVVLFQAEKELNIASINDSYGWDALISGSIMKIVVPGDHLGIYRKPNVNILAEKISASVQPHLREPKRE